MTARTHGPWSVESWSTHDSDGALEFCGFQVVDAQSHSVDTCTLEDESEAHLYIIAAAPDLLAAAQLALAECCDLIATPAGDALQAAITKATGQKP